MVWIIQHKEATYSKKYSIAIIDDHHQGVSLISIQTNPFQCYLSLSVWCVCVCVLFIYTISISIICVLEEETSLTVSNQQIYDFHKRLSLSHVHVPLCVCVISNQITSKNPHYVSDLSKLDAMMHKTHIKFLLVLRFQGSTCVDPQYH